VWHESSILHNFLPVGVHSKALHNCSVVSVLHEYFTIQQAHVRNHTWDPSASPPCLIIVARRSQYPPFNHRRPSYSGRCLIPGCRTLCWHVGTVIPSLTLLVPMHFRCYNHFNNNNNNDNKNNKLYSVVTQMKSLHRRLTTFEHVSATDVSNHKKSRMRRHRSF